MRFRRLWSYSEAGIPGVRSFFLTRNDTEYRYLDGGREKRTYPSVDGTGRQADRIPKAFRLCFWLTAFLRVAMKCT